MLGPGLAKKVTIHVNEDTSSRSDFLSREIIALLLREGVAGASLFRPEAGFGSHHRIHTAEGGIDTAHHMPLRIEFIDTAQKVERILPFLRELLTDGLVEAHDTIVLLKATGTAQ
ncbi:MAG TPA: DUF190 domain-containing protein [Bryobacteraceae bacterium]|nr:DUF190 domain-containing protein [Bryobacteraceae bacterium]